MKDYMMIFQSDMLFLCLGFSTEAKNTPGFREEREREKLFGASSSSNVCSFRLCILQK